jgi:hypothetical protein
MHNCLQHKKCVFLLRRREKQYDTWGGNIEVPNGLAALLDHAIISATPRNMPINTFALLSTFTVTLEISMRSEKDDEIAMESDDTGKQRARSPSDEKNHENAAHLRPFLPWPISIKWPCLERFNDGFSSGSAATKLCSAKRFLNKFSSLTRSSSIFSGVNTWTLKTVLAWFKGRK